MANSIRAAVIATRNNASILYIALFLALALIVAGAPLPSTSPHAAFADEANKPVKVKWISKSSRIYCKVNGAKQRSGVCVIKGKSYLFDKKGVQKTGWQKIGKEYFYFKPATKSKAFMVKSKVVNGIKLNKEGRAVLTTESKDELNVLVKATRFVEQYTKPTWSQKKKLRVCFDVLKNKYSERSYRRFSPKKGWHRTYALDIFNKKSGDCDSFAAAFAYIANAIGCKNCKVVSSGGHSWAEVNGAVYDPEWSKHCRTKVFAYPYSKSGRGGTPNYKRARKYVVTIAPRTKAFGGKTLNSKNQSGGALQLVSKGGALYGKQDGKTLKEQWATKQNARYYFLTSGKAATGPAKIKGTWYVFGKNGKLLTGKKTRVVTVGTEKYRVTKAGKAKAGWDSSKTHRYAKDGRMLTGAAVVGEKFFAFSAKGRYDAAKTAQLRRAAKMDSDATPLLALLGSPSKRVYTASCYFIEGADGNLIGGQDGRLTYPHFTVYTFKADNGIEYYRGAEER